MESYEENNPPDVSLEAVKNKIKIFDRNIDHSTLKFLYHGSYNVFEFASDFLIKIPSKILVKMFGSKLIVNETKKLKYLKNKISFRIPDPEFVSEDENDPFYVYRKVPGISLSRVYSKLNDQQKIMISGQIGQIVSEIHSLPEREVTIIDFLGGKESTHEYLESITKFHMKIQEIIYPKLNEDQCNWISQLFNTFFNSVKTDSFYLTTTHNDFDTSNIIVDPEKDFHVSGIIDFEEFGFGDPAVDLLFQEEGHNFHNRVLENYLGYQDKTFSLRMDFHKKKGCLYYLLTGTEQNLPKLYDHGVKMLEYRMKMKPIDFYLV